MTKFLYFLRLVRWPNLLFIIFIMFSIRYGLIYASIANMIEGEEIQLQLSGLYFTFLVCSVVCISAAGYIINDYFDIKIDQINKPDKVYIGDQIKRREAIIMHWTLNIVGLALGLLVCVKYHFYGLFAIFIFSAGALWFYSTTYKHQVLIGNIIIALLAAFVPLLPGVIEISLLNQKYLAMWEYYGISINYIAYWILGFAFFSFLFTLIREMIKDVADVEGDKELNSRTMAVVWGTKVSKIVVSVLYLFTLFCVYKLYHSFLRDSFVFWYINLTVGLFTLLSLYFLLNGKSRKDYILSSNLNKVAMLFGILFMWVYVLKITGKV